MSVDPTASPAPGTKNPLQQLEALGLAVIDGGSAHEEFSYPGGYTGTFKNELGVEMQVSLNGDIKIDVKPAPAS
jgi:hypothetical protein